MAQTTPITQAWWTTSTEAERAACVERVASQLPKGSSFVSFLASGVALFEFPGGAEAVLVPGNRAKVGFSAASFVPPPAMVKVWPAIRDSVELYEKKTLLEYLEWVSSPLREAEVPALVVECRKRQQGWRWLPDGDPAADTWVGGRALEPNGVYRSNSFGDRMGQLRVRTGPDPSQFEVDERVKTSHSELIASLGASGYRLLTADEWEYCCGGGRRSLFRWGDEVPLGSYPDDIRQEQMPELCGGNGLGLFINQNSTYMPELVAEPKVRVGGDGGNRLCADLPSLLVWMVLSTSFRERVYPVRERVDGAYARRAVEVE